MKYSFSTNGITVEFEDNSKEILEALANAVDRGLKSIGMTAESYAKKNLTEQRAVDTGQLRNETTYKVDGQDVYIGTDVEHGVYVELGTGKYSLVGGTTKESWTYMDEFGNWHMAFPMRARPFLVPAARDHAEEYRNILKDSLENA